MANDSKGVKKNLHGVCSVQWPHQVSAIKAELFNEPQLQVLLASLEEYGYLRRFRNFYLLKQLGNAEHFSFAQTFAAAFAIMLSSVKKCFDMAFHVHWNGGCKILKNVILRASSWSRRCRTIRLFAIFRWCLTSAAIGWMRLEH